MKKLLPILFCFTLYVLSFTPSHAQFRLPRGEQNVNVGAQVGQYYLNLSGYASPNASIALTSNGILIRSTIANPDGTFSISQILMNPELKTVCFHMVDFKRVGFSDACLDLPPQTGDITIRDILLPPTIALSKTRVPVGEEVTIFGYSMPNSTVTIYLKDGKSFKAKTDSTGYYEQKFKPKDPGEYHFTAEAEYNDIPSLKPTNEVILVALSLPQQVTETVEKTGKETTNKLVNTPLGFVLLVTLLVFLIITLLVWILKKKGLIPHFLLIPKLPIPGLGSLIFFADKFKKHRALHHDWLLEFIVKVENGEIKQINFA